MHTLKKFLQHDLLSLTQVILSKVKQAGLFNPVLFLFVLLRVKRSAFNKTSNIKC